MIEHVEVAPDLTDDQLEWIAETEARLADLQRRIDAGEKINLHGWDQPNWIDKVTPA